MAAEELASLAQLRGGRVRLVGYPSAVATVVPDALRLLGRRPPGRRGVAGGGRAAGGVGRRSARARPTSPSSSRYDGPPADDGALAWLPLGRERVDLVLPPDHRLAARTRPSLAALADDTWIAGCPRCRQHLVGLCRDAGFEPRVAHATDDYVAVQALVAAGLGVTVLPRSALRAFRHPEVVVRPVARPGRAARRRRLPPGRRAGARDRRPARAADPDHPRPRLAAAG